MVIQHNMAAICANYKLNVTTKEKLKSTEKLSTGYRINRAADDAAGLAISEKLRAQIRGLEKSNMNITEGISYCNVADGALNEVHSMLSRVKELSVQAANGTYTDSDRASMDQEVQQIKDEISSILTRTNYNNINVWQASYVPDVGGYSNDFSLYNVKDSTGSYYGGVIYMNHRYSWSDLGIDNWDTDKHVFTSDETFQINASILHNNGVNATNDSNSPHDDYKSLGNTGALFTIKTTEGSRAIDIQKNYSWTADEHGIYIDGVITDGTVPSAGNTTWEAMGIIPNQNVPGGTYTFDYYGQRISYDVPMDGETWEGFLLGFNNPLTQIDWHSEYFYAESKEVADIIRTTSYIGINNSNKDYIAVNQHPYIVYADQDGIWMENASTAKADMGKSGANVTLIRWEDITNTENYPINSWGMDTDGSGNTNQNADGFPDGGDQYVTVSSKAVYTYVNSFLHSAEPFSFDFKILDEASRQAVIDDINNSIYNNSGVFSPIGISSYTSGGGDFISAGSSANLSFLTQRDELNRQFVSPTETFANGVLSKTTDGSDTYAVTLTGTSGGVYQILSTKNVSEIEDEISTAIISQMQYLYNLVGDSTYPNTSIEQLSEADNLYTYLGLGSKNISFSNGADTVTLQMSLAAIKYANLISDTAYAAGETPFGTAFADKVKAYVEDNLDLFLNSTLSLGGTGATYQSLLLIENSVKEDKVVTAPIVSGFTMSLQIQSGAVQDTKVNIQYEYLRLGTLGIKSSNLLTSNDAQAAITSADRAIRKVSEQRGLFGSYTNRLEHAYSINAMSSENLQTAESKIRDADMAKEAMTNMRVTVLQQAGQSVLAQANQSADFLLNLLK